MFKHVQKNVLEKKNENLTKMNTKTGAYKRIHTSEDGSYVEALMYGPSSDVWLAFRCMDHPFAPRNYPMEHFKLDSTYMLRWCILGVSLGGVGGTVGQNGKI